MTLGRPPYPFDENRYLGSLSRVGAFSLTVNLPAAATRSSGLYFGNRLGGGEVGELVLIECEELAVFGRLVEVRLPERERLAVETRHDSKANDADIHPQGFIQILATVSLSELTVSSGITRYPKLGSRVYAASPQFIRWLTTSPRHVADGREVLLSFASLPSHPTSLISLTPEQLFGRHCAILGATGGGKSWTLARIMQESLKHRAKVVLLDATGEYWRLSDPAVRHVCLGTGIVRPSVGTAVVSHPFYHMLDVDLFAIFRPSGQSQGPKMREAIKSLRLARLEPSLASPSGLLLKALRPRGPFESASARHAAELEADHAEFDVQAIPGQIMEECIWPTARNDESRFGDYSNETTFCLPLQLRAAGIVRAPEFECIFRPGATPSVYDEVEHFIASPDEKILRISLQNVPFANHVREIVVNAIGRHFLRLGRQGSFRTQPVVIALDEAHQFLNRHIGDEFQRMELDAVGLLAKEGRKFSITVCIATQRPRDIPQDVLSQMGTMIVHRLVNEYDRDIVEKAAGDIDKTSASFLPVLSPGEAIVLGADIPVPLTLRIEPPLAKPDSSGPDFQSHWKVPETNEES